MDGEPLLSKIKTETKGGTKVMSIKITSQSKCNKSTMLMLTHLSYISSTHWPMGNVPIDLKGSISNSWDRFCSFEALFVNLHGIETHWWKVNAGSGNGLVSSGNKPLPEPMLTQIYRPYGVFGPQCVNTNTCTSGVLLWDIVALQALINRARSMINIDLRAGHPPRYTMQIISSPGQKLQIGFNQDRSGHTWNKNVQHDRYNNVPMPWHNVYTPWLFVLSMCYLNACS